MIPSNNRLGFNIKGIIYDLSEILDIYYDNNDKELIIEFKNKKERDFFSMNKEDSDYYIKLFESTFDKVYE